MSELPGDTKLHLNIFLSVSLFEPHKREYGIVHEYLSQNIFRRGFGSASSVSKIILEL